MAKKGKKRGRGKYIKLNNLEDKKSLFGTIKSIFDIFKFYFDGKNRDSRHKL